jgi:hypothetical protein
MVYVVIKPSTKRLVGPNPVEVRAVIAFWWLAKGLQEDMVPGYLNYPKF